tara:strand:+ start:211 stop:345 length:135 start_codon:yes stop_codon:yes gene_type:complete
MAKMVKKGDLPAKVCETCKKQYAWRKKMGTDLGHYSLLLKALQI